MSRHRVTFTYMTDDAADAEEAVEMARQAVADPDYGAEVTTWLMAVLGDDGVTRCPRCSGDEFTYDENYAESRIMLRNEDSVLSFGGDDGHGEGDDDPGVCCSTCGAVLDLPGETELDWG